jgi:hypothetical protein
MEKLFNWCVLLKEDEDNGQVILCPTERMADDVMAQVKDRCFIAIKYPTRDLE